MEQHYFNQNHIEPAVHTDYADSTNYYNYGHHQKFPFIPVQMRLKQNKERRLIIQKQKQRQNQYILQKRRQKQDNVQRILKQKQDARQNAKLLFTNMQKTFNNKSDEEFKQKADDIEEKIYQCRTRADQYKTMYKKKIQDDRLVREKSVRDRRWKKDKQEKDRSLNHHLAQWRNYERKIAEKYRGEQKNPQRMYEQMAKKQSQINQILQRHKLQHNVNMIQKQNQIQGQKKPEKAPPLQNFQNQGVSSHQQKNNPIYSYHEIGSFGLSKSIKNPQKLIREMKQFLQNKKMVEDASKDEDLVGKFQEFLDQMSKTETNV